MLDVTIGMPVYNGEEFLDEALACLSAQTYPYLEILISDNASTDSTPEIIEKWKLKDSRIRCVRQEETISALDNFLWVINNAHGKWFCYAAHDDKWSANYVEALLSPLKDNPNAIISVPHQILIDRHGKEKSERPYKPPRDGASLTDIIKNNFSIVHSAWYYALYDRSEFMSLQQSHVHFDQYWGRDFATFIPFLFSDSIVGNDVAIFYQRETGYSGSKYRPKNAIDQYHHYRDFWKDLLYYMNKSELSLTQKIVMFPIWLRYVRNVVKFRRMLKTFVKEAFRFRIEKSQF